MNVLFQCPVPEIARFAKTMETGERIRNGAKRTVELHKGKEQKLPVRTRLIKFVSMVIGKLTYARSY